MQEQLAQLKWPSLAQDLAVMTVPGSPITDLKDVLDTYGITQDELKEIVKIPKFRDMFETCYNEFKSQGSKAASIYRATSLSQALSEKLFRDAMNGTIDAKDSLKLLELLMKGSGQFSPEEKTQVNTQVNVGVALPIPKGLNNPKLKHLG